ncbi:DUF1707 SHOCT-like domain-containing protein [Amycolatopsis panacis]|uniref:DUF1707 domain-containing protein n=1 Tax=Amycolatopsis panacis TaxID=2340917 RepID=A0A419I1W6_9PSEU|nr:DUF1707 domain-containing protein [Amycolatopsis panacis]RJQ83767.1 DUF1707 domain-containing protein [Amycolatopsis panacis]
MSDMRLSDEERQDALDVLSEHVRTGRLDIDEYAVRSAKVTEAKLVSELIPLFEDLPSPRPSVLLAAPRAAAEPERVRESVLAGFAMRYALPISIAVSIAVLVLSRGRLFIVFALPVAALLLTGWRRR